MSRNSLNQVLGIASAVLIVQAALFYSASRGERVPLAQPLSAFPSEIGPWRVTQEGVVDEETRQVLRADDLLTRNYGSQSGAGANLFIAYFQTQRTGQAPHSPKNCLPGSGWQPIPEKTGTIAVDVGSEKININRYIVARGENESVVLYWYQSQGRVIADEFAAKYYLIRDSIQKHRSDTALVRIVVSAQTGQEDMAEALAVSFAKDAYPIVKGYLPQ